MSCPMTGYPCENATCSAIGCVLEPGEPPDYDVYPEDYLVTGDAAHDVLICEGCGCSALNPCPGGCVWATERRCSRCV